MSVTLSVTTGFNLTTGYFNFTDTSNYSGAGDSGVKGCLQILGPGGINVYTNPGYANPQTSTPDMTENSITNNTIQLPVDGHGNVLIGSYTINYKAYISAGTDAGQTKTFSSTIVYAFVPPLITIGQTVDAINAIFYSKDNTNYVVDGVTPSTTISHTVTDTTNPARTNITNTNSQNTVVWPNLYNDNYLTIISTIATYSFTGYSVTVTLTGQQTFTVNVISLADVYSGTKACEQRFRTAQQNNDFKQIEFYRDQFSDLMNYWGLLEMAINNNDSTEAAYCLQQMMQIGNILPGSTSGQVIPSTPEGDRYKTYSATSITIGTGTKTFTVGANLSYTTGTTCRAQDATPNASNYVEGPVISYIGTALTINVVNIGGSGTIANWNINIGS